MESLTYRIVLILSLNVYWKLSQSYEFRLQKWDEHANDGIAQIFYNGTWGAVDIKTNDPSDFSAKAMCNSIGLGYEGFITNNRDHSSESNLLLVWIKGFSCELAKGYASDCINETYLNLTNTTVSSILHCYAFELTGIRLSGGILPSEGFLEARISDRWSAVGYVGRYNQKDALDDLICRTLGYIEESVIQPNKHGWHHTIMTIWSCPIIGSVKLITRACSVQKGVYLSQYYSHPKEINCKAIRVVDGPSSLEGRVEAGLFGKLRTICGLGFDAKAANVTCTSLGYSGFSKFYSNTVFGAGNLSLYSRKISCSGLELTLEHCNHSDTDIHECGTDDVVGVSCKGGLMKLETFNKNRSYEGMLTSYQGDHWYIVLGRVSDTTARTLCSMLGFGRIGFSSLLRYNQNLYYYKSRISCFGNESFIEECVGELQYCLDQQFYGCYYVAAGTGILSLFCSDYEIQRITIANDVIELNINNETWSVSDAFFTNDTASSVCRILGHSYENVEHEHKLKHLQIRSTFRINTDSGHTSAWSSPVESSDKDVIGGLICESGATTISECQLKHLYSFRDYYSHNDLKKMSITCNHECRQGYFGSNCAKCHCKSVNSLSCHNITGACTCKQGWSGTTCSDDVNECDAATNVCNDPSVCVNTAGAYFCQCPIGMSMIDTSNGGKCEVCSNNTYGINCLTMCSCNETNTYTKDQICEPKTGQCFCKPEWTGISCEVDVNECAVSTNILCQQNNTECMNKEGGYTCDCINSLKPENGTCVPLISVQVPAEEYCNSCKEMLVIALSVGGSIVMLLIISIFAGVYLLRKQRGDGIPPVKQKISSQEQQNRFAPDLVNINDRNDSLALSDNVRDEIQLTDNRYQSLRYESDVAGNEYSELSTKVENQDVLDNENTNSPMSNKTGSDGYVNQVEVGNDLPIVDISSSEKYLKQTINNNTTNIYIRIQPEDDGASRRYTNILGDAKHAQVEDSVVITVVKGNRE